MLETIRNQPFLVAILAGTTAQLLKVISFLMLEKRVNYRRFVQTDGSPNMHSAAFSALALAIGLRDGFGTMAFALAVCVMAIIVVDTMNVKNATSRQAEAILQIMDRLRKKTPARGARKAGLSYTPLDVFTGLVVGIAFALLVV
ncbi:MAG: divergent PAP2 family protein [Candidatus Krumholzibacteria bacterium]|nr:divergent PAP2 family protein [Candidatus Krumholzibacteria bacterium]